MGGGVLEMNMNLCILCAVGCRDNRTAHYTSALQAAMIASLLPGPIQGSGFKAPHGMELGYLRNLSPITSDLVEELCSRSRLLRNYI